MVGICRTTTNFCVVSEGYVERFDNAVSRWREFCREREGHRPERNSAENQK